MAVFYSFHYERDVHRVQLIRNIGSVEGQKLLNAQEWEAVRQRGTKAIQNWIDEQMKGRVLSSYLSAHKLLLAHGFSMRFSEHGTWVNLSSGYVFTDFHLWVL